MSAPIDAGLSEAIRAESNRALSIGGRLSMLVAGVATLGTVVLSLRDPAFWPVNGFPLLCAVASFAVWQLAQRGRVFGVTAWVLFLSFASAPFFTLLAFEAVLPWGAATFFFGPIATGWIVVIVLSGFTFEPRLSIGVGVFSAVTYFAVYALARPHLALLPGSVDPTFRADLMGWEVQSLRSLLLVGVGILVGSVSTLARRLLLRVKEEVLEREAVSRIFGQYVSEEVKDKLVRERATLTGERKTVAVLFSDLRGFTTLSEGRAPSEVVALLNRYFDGMVRAITANGGTVDKFIGDAVMATFGGLVPLENPAASALDAALAMREALARLNGEWKQAGLPELDNGIGLHFGEVLQGPIGSAERKEFTVIGDVVNTASRLESATKELGAHVVVSDALADALPEARRASLRPLGEVKLKGKEQGVRCHTPGV